MLAHEDMKSFIRAIETDTLFLQALHLLVPFISKIDILHSVIFVLSIARLAISL